MKFFNYPLQVKRFVGEDELKDYFEFRKQNDKTELVNPDEIRILDIPFDAPLLHQETEAHYGVEIPDQVYTDADSDTGLLFKKGNEVLPVLFTAMPGLAARSGVYGETLMTRKASSTREALPMYVRGEIFTSCLHTYKHKVNVLKRDDSIARIASELYADLSAEEGYEITKAYLEKTYSGCEFKGAECSAEYLYAMLKPSQADLSDLEYRLKNRYKASLFVRFSTSDVTNSKMRVMPMIELKKENDSEGAMIPIDGSNPIEIEHIAGNTPDRLEEKLPNMAKLMNAAEDDVERLGNTQIKHVCGCLQHVTRGFTGLSKKSVLGTIRKELGGSSDHEGTAIDVYMLILDSISLQCETGNGLLVKDFVQLTERAAGYLGRDFSKFDKSLEDIDE